MASQNIGASSPTLSRSAEAKRRCSPFFPQRDNALRPLALGPEEIDLPHGAGGMRWNEALEERLTREIYESRWESVVRVYLFLGEFVEKRGWARRRVEHIGKSLAAFARH